MLVLTLWLILLRVRISWCISNLNSLLLWVPDNKLILALENTLEKCDIDIHLLSMVFENCLIWGWGVAFIMIVPPQAIGFVKIEPIASVMEITLIKEDLNSDFQFTSNWKILINFFFHAVG